LSNNLYIQISFGTREKQMHRLVSFLAWLTMAFLFAPYAIVFLLYVARRETFFGIDTSALISGGTLLFLITLFLFLFLEKRLQTTAAEGKLPEIGHPITLLRRLRSIFSRPLPAIRSPALAAGEAQFFPDELYQEMPRVLRSAGYYTGLPSIRTEIGENAGRVFFWIPVAVPFIFFLGSGELNWFFLSLPIALEAIYFPMFIAAIVSYMIRGKRFRHGILCAARVVDVKAGRSEKTRWLETEVTVNGTKLTFHSYMDVSYRPLPEDLAVGSPVGLLYLPSQKTADLYIHPKLRLDAEPGPIPQLRQATQPDVELPRWLTVFGFIWFFSAILGPPIGWGLTGGLPGIYESGAWQKWFLARIIVGGLFPAGVAIIFCAGSMFYRHMRIAGTSFLLLSLLPLWSIRNTWLDYRSGPQTTRQVITAFKEEGDLRAPWRDAIPAYRGMAEGGYTARFADGHTADFHCEPICLSEEKPIEMRRHIMDRHRILLNRNCQVTEFAHLGEIVDLDCPDQALNRSTQSRP
jgi:hypothetical protein